MWKHTQQVSKSINMLRRTKSTNKAASTWSSAAQIMFIFELKWNFSRAPKQWGGRDELCYWRVYRGQQLPKQSFCSNHRGIFHSAGKKEWQPMMDGVLKSTELGEELGADRDYHVHVHVHHAPEPSSFVMEMAPQACPVSFFSVYMPASYSLHSPAHICRALQQGSCAWKRLTSCPVF